MTDSNVRTWARSEITAQLEKILNSPEFKRNRSASAFLTFVVDETLEGRGPRLKAFTVAMAVFNRDVNFDPQNNSIVRVQAARLRQLMMIYYTGAGAHDPIRISMPVGRYAVTFERMGADSPSQAEVEPAAAEQPPAMNAVPAIALPEAPPLELCRSRRFALLIFALAVAGLAGSLVLFLRQSALQPIPSELFAAFTDRPTIFVKDDSAKGLRVKDLGLDADLRDTIEGGLSAFDNVTVIQRNLEGNSPKLSYSLVMGRGVGDIGKLWFSFKLIHDASGDLVWSRTFVDVEATNAAMRQVGAVVIRAVADVDGAVDADVVARTKRAMRRPRGYFCELAAFEYVQAHETDDFIKVRDCLEAELSKNSQDTRFLSALADYLVRRYLDANTDSLGSGDLHRAEQVAESAYASAPWRADAVFSMFLTQFYQKTYADAFVSAQKVLELNPNSGVMTAQIGSAYIARGQYERGEALLTQLAKTELGAPGFTGAYLALSAYMHGDEVKFLDYCHAGNAENSALGLLINILACRKLEETVAVDHARKTLRETFPGVAADIPAALDRLALLPEIQTKLLADLRQAGGLAGQ